MAPFASMSLEILLSDVLYNPKAICVKSLVVFLLTFPVFWILNTISLWSLLPSYYLWPHLPLFLHVCVQRPCRILPLFVLSSICIKKLSPIWSRNTLHCLHNAMWLWWGPSLVIGSFLVIVCIQHYPLRYLLSRWCDRPRLHGSCFFCLCFWPGVSYQISLWFHTGPQHRQGDVL